MAIPIKKWNDWILLQSNNEVLKFHKENEGSFDLYMLFAAETLTYRIMKAEIDVEKFRLEYLYNSIEIDEPFSFKPVKVLEPELVQDVINDVDESKDEQTEVNENGIQHT